MGHPIRMYVLELLVSQNCCYSGDLTEDLRIAKSTLSQHLKELKEAGFEVVRLETFLNEDNIYIAKPLGRNEVNADGGS